MKNANGQNFFNFMGRGLRQRVIWYYEIKFKLFIWLKLLQSNLDSTKYQCDLLLLVSAQYYLASESAILIQSLLKMTSLIKNFVWRLHIKIVL